MLAWLLTYYTRKVEEGYECHSVRENRLENVKVACLETLNMNPTHCNIFAPNNSSMT